MIVKRTWVKIDGRYDTVCKGWFLFGFLPLYIVKIEGRPK